MYEDNIDHSIWLQTLYVTYSQGKFPVQDCDVVLDDIIYKSITPPQMQNESFDEKWLKYLPPLIRRQPAMS